MKHVLRLAPLVWALSLGEVLAACETRVEPVERPAAADLTAPGTTPGATRAELTSLVVVPAVGSEVRKDTVLTIDFEYRIPGFENGQFKVMPVFKTGTYGSDSFDVDGKDPSIALKTAAGKVRMCVPLATLYGEDAERVRWPLELQLLILKLEDAQRSVGVGASKLLKLNSVEVPASAVERQKKAPPPEYDDALAYVFDHFTQQSALYKVCLRRYQSLQPRLTPAFRAWEARHKADIDFVSGLKFEELKEQFKGRSDFAMSSLDMLGEGIQKAYDSQDGALLRPRCDEIIEQVNPEDDHTDGMIGHYLQVLRDWRGKK